LIKAAAALFVGVLTWFAGLGLLILHEEPGLSRGKADVAIVLGAAVRSDGSPSPVFEGRLAHGVDLIRQGRVRALLLTGGKGEGASVSEAASGRRWAMERGVDPAAILTEERSQTTSQNLREAAAVMRKKGLRTALLVSDPLHLPRAIRMARDLGMEVQPSPAPATRYRSLRTRLPFLARENFFLTGYWLTGE
jgi:uncharacterized SAM-binding protein YcdF (DUF218 family)